MPYVENRTIHDADSHVMEFPDTICEFIEVSSNFSPSCANKIKAGSIR